MKILILSLLVIAVFCENASTEKLFRSECCEDYCYGDDKVRPQNTHLASKTAYQRVRGLDYASQAVVPNCKPVKFWLLSRHGTRLPSAKTIGKLGGLETRRDEIIKNYETSKTKPAKGGLCAGDIQLLKNWVLDKNITADHENFLTDQGWNDLKLLASRYQAVYPNILTKEYNPNNFLFRHTDIQRTEASYKAFVEGLFGTEAYKNIKLAPIPQNDTLLSPYSNCPLWKDQDDKKDDSDKDISKFEYSDLMNQTVSDISTRLGYENALSFEEISVMLDMCKYESAWFLDKSSPWCAAFTLAQVEVLEYLEDINYEYKSGYIGKINANVPCEVIQDMLKRLNTEDQPQVTAYFSHSTLIQLTLVALGAYKDSTLLKYNNYNTMTDRKWRTSLLDPFGSNIAAIKYDCSEDKKDSPPKVLFFHNQKPLQLDWCTNGLCKWSDVMSKYEKYANANCMNSFCVESSGNFIRGSIVLIFISIVYNFFSKFLTIFE